MSKCTFQTSLGLALIGTSLLSFSSIAVTPPKNERKHREQNAKPDETDKKQVSSASLPKYVVINDPSSANKEVLRTPTKRVNFPLDKKTREIISHLSDKFDQEENCSGLAAPQLGYDLRILVLAVEDDEEIKKFRPDLTDTLPKSIWINPSWKPLSDEKSIDWEACFSVADTYGRVPRFTKISYEAWTPEGKKIEGIARGFLARVIQHESDHLDGILFIDYVPEKDRLTQEQLKQLKEKEKEGHRGENTPK